VPLGGSSYVSQSFNELRVVPVAQCADLACKIIGAHRKNVATLDPESKVPASLIIVDYQLEAMNEGSLFSSVTTSYTFSEYTGPHRCGDDKPASPAALAYAPFEYLTKINESTATERSQNNQEAGINPQVEGFSLGKIRFGRESESTHEQKYFKRGRAGRHFDHSRVHNVWWNLVCNKSQALSITPKFRIAMLIERSSDSKFQVEFKISARGGFGYKISSILVSIYLGLYSFYIRTEQLLCFIFC